MGVDSSWTWDHFFPIRGGVVGGPHFEGWTLLAALGPQTKQATVGCLGVLHELRNPALLSAMAKTLAHLTHGRLVLGLGAGWFEREYVEYGYDFPPTRKRLRQLEQGIGVIRERWAKDEPKPVRGTIPILIGGGERVTLRITARHADLWNGLNDPGWDWPNKNRILDEWCRKEGRDPAAIERTVSISPGQLDQADSLIAAGAQHLIMRLEGPFDLAPVERLLAWRERAC
jgi:probable F420-dependent oxidoreductase